MSENVNDAPEKKRKAANDAATTQRTDNMTSGEILRHAREKRKLSLSDVSSAIHVRAAQLKAIEEGDIDALPGMTYAAGFVKSYAGFLKLNPIELSNKFKAEHGAMKPVMQDLPEIKPVVESRMPDPRVVGAAAFCAIVLLLGWAFFSGGSSDRDLTAMATGTASVDNPDAAIAADDAAAVAAQAAKEDTDTVTTTTTTAEDTGDGNDSASAEKTPVETTEAAPAADTPDAKADEKAAEAKEEKAAQEDKAEKTAKAEDAAKPKAEEVTDAVKGDDVAKADEKTELLPSEKPDLASPAQDAAAADAEQIAIRKPASRIVFKARQPSWIQVSDADDHVVFKRLLRAGEQYSVPDGKGYTLITTNAGGFDVLVDGEKAPALGKNGEILRGLELDPAELKKTKFIRSRLNN